MYSTVKPNSKTYEAKFRLYKNSYFEVMLFFGCQVEETYGFPNDHKQNAAMFQCDVNSCIY